MATYVKWQVASRLLGGEFIRPWIKGSRFVVRAGETGITGNIYTGLQEYPDMGYLLHVLRADDGFADVGANAGAYSILASAVVGATTWAFEPVPATFRRLDDNVRINRMELLVQHRNIALGREPGRIRFTSELDTVNHALADGEHAAAEIEVAVSTLDAELGADRPAVIKIDVEGFEKPVLDGGVTLLADERLHSVILELNGSGARYGYGDGEIVGLMRDHGFGTYSYDPMGRRLIDLAGRSLTEGNTLFLRNLGLIEARIRDAPRVPVLDKML
ncbi:MAG: FkbM family methyltransferase [Gammaproteobacteria bacterium]|nr:FkbM family methyltransferase [Gammaproteobacteria bacterium]